MRTPDGRGAWSRSLPPPALAVGGAEVWVDDSADRSADAVAREDAAAWVGEFVDGAVGRRDIAGVGAVGRDRVGRRRRVAGGVALDVARKRDLVERVRQLCRVVGLFPVQRPIGHTRAERDAGRAGGDAIRGVHGAPTRLRALREIDPVDDFGREVELRILALHGDEGVVADDEPADQASAARVGAAALAEPWEGQRGAAAVTDAEPRAARGALVGGELEAP